MVWELVYLWAKGKGLSDTIIFTIGNFVVAFLSNIVYDCILQIYLHRPSMQKYKIQKGKEPKSWVQFWVLCMRNKEFHSFLFFSVTWSGRLIYTYGFPSSSHNQFLGTSCLSFGGKKGILFLSPLSCLPSSSVSTILYFINWCQASDLVWGTIGRFNSLFSF